MTELDDDRSPQYRYCHDTVLMTVGTLGLQAEEVGQSGKSRK